MSDLHVLRREAEELIARHLDPTWSFTYDNAKRRAGACDYTRQRITVSRYLSARYDDETNRQTLLHEIAHALAGSRAGHGAAWKRTARAIGYTGGVTHRGETATELAPWVGVCPAGHVAYRHRVAARPTSCAVCSRTFDDRYLFVWTRREITAEARRAAMTPREVAGTP
ncbi:SprT-like domain-containing protein [Microbacterium dextranolyticum]|uniref:SprT-like domain-containing protein n=1 Tax=Microbacterium dextranolyticum TaxID=36806 RepID=A0A9W6HKL6_9MICO|nr:SprT-like domain-containing protein [Microbacterium dextranolyticum]MBM7462001.1 putative SprT family Zn-dependent metalloprotease [Microbacterium dextranolyticum]GLJ94243.1 hypothetical protein GCM10017591_03040 [Microbacterium dextranolyticum]